MCDVFDAYRLYYEGKWVGGWALEIESFLGPVKWHRVNRRVPFGVQKTWDFQGPRIPSQDGYPSLAAPSLGPVSRRGRQWAPQPWEQQWAPQLWGPLQGDAGLRAGISTWLCGGRMAPGRDRAWKENQRQFWGMYKSNKQHKVVWSKLFALQCGQCCGVGKVQIRHSILMSIRIRLRIQLLL